MAPSLAGAHVLQGDASGSPGDGLVLMLLVAPALVYVVGLARIGVRSVQGRTSITRAACFFGGEVALAACLLSPLDAWSAERFSAHMVQHELLMLVAAPLLVLGRPLPMFLWAFPAPARAALGRWTRTQPVSCVWSLLMHPATGWSAHALALWGWHVPLLFRAALQNPALHDLQHLSFVLTALLFWSGLFLSRQALHRGAAVLYLFSTTVHTSVLGALITLVDRPMYVPDAHVLPAGALQDQQLGGLIMWVPGSMVYVAAGLWLFLRWVRAADSAQPGGNAGWSG